MKKNLIPGVLSLEEEKFVEKVVDDIGYVSLATRKDYYESLINLRKYNLFDPLKKRVEAMQFVKDKNENTLLKNIFILIAEIGLYKEEKTFDKLIEKVILPDIIHHNSYPKLFESVTGLTIMGYRLKVEKETEE